jgi:hypothetical protein
VIAPDSKNGRAHSTNGASPDIEGLNGPEVEIVIADRIDALERALGTVRRRMMTLKVFSLSRRGGEFVLTLRGDEGVVLPDRWIAELGALVDVRQVKVAVK